MMDATDYKAISLERERQLDEEWERYNEEGKPDEDGYEEDPYNDWAYDCFRDEECQHEG